MDGHERLGCFARQAPSDETPRASIDSRDPSPAQDGPVRVQSLSPRAHDAPRHCLSQVLGRSGNHCMRPGGPLPSIVPVTGGNEGSRTSTRRVDPRPGASQPTIEAARAPRERLATPHGRPARGYIARPGRTPDLCVKQPDEMPARREGRCGIFAMRWRGRTAANSRAPRAPWSTRPGSLDGSILPVRPRRDARVYAARPAARPPRGQRRRSKSPARSSRAAARALRATCAHHPGLARRRPRPLPHDPRGPPSSSE